MKMIPSNSTILAASVAALLSACGGGGGDSTPLGTQVTITSANQTTVARSTLAGGFSIGGTAINGADGRAHAQSAGRTGAVPGVHALEQALQDALARLSVQRRSISSAQVHPAAVTNSSGSCSLGGTYSFTTDDHDNSSSTTAGDSVTMVYSHCVESDGSLDGTMILTYGNAASGTLVAGTLTYQHLAVGNGGTTVTLDGSASLTESSASGSTTDTFTVGSSGLTLAAAASGYSDSVTYESGTTIVEVSADTGAQSSVRFDGTLSSTLLGGRVTVATLQPIVTTTADYPISGQLRVTGASASKLLITVASATQVQLQLDADGNGSYEGSTLVNWTTLLPQ